MVATIILTVLIVVEAPQLQGSPGNLEIVIVFMGGAAVAAIMPSGTGGALPANMQRNTWFARFE